MNAVMITSEEALLGAPGGVGEVVHSLSDALSARGCRVSIILPLCREREEDFEPVPDLPPLRIQGVDGFHDTQLFRSRRASPGVPVYGIETWSPTSGSTPRGDAATAGWAAFFCRSALAALGAIGKAPDIIHCHGWQTALVPAYLRAGIDGEDDAARSLGLFDGTATIFTVQDVREIGEISSLDFSALGLPEESFARHGFEQDGSISLLRGAMLFADEIATVSWTYARTLAAQGGGGFDLTLANRDGRVVGIRNGLDTETWNPADDPHLAASFSSQELKGKRRCKADLLVEAELDGDLRTPVLALIVPFAMEPCLDLLRDALPGLLQRGVCIVVLAGEEVRFDTDLHCESDMTRNRIHLESAWTEDFLHKVLAGSDMLLLPSPCEPSGFGPMIAQRYGTVPIVSPRGGLSDIVVDPEEEADEATGFRMAQLDSYSLEAAVARALEAYSRPALWEELQIRGMEREVSWEAPARRYHQLYRRAVHKRRRREPPKPPFRISPEGWRARPGADLTQLNIEVLARAIAEEFGNQPRTDRVFVVGHDGCSLAAEFAEAVVGVLAAHGLRVVFDAEPRPLPVLAHAIGAAPVRGGLIVSGGADPSLAGGLVLFGSWGGVELSETWERVLALSAPHQEGGDFVDRISLAEATRVSRFDQRDFLPGYQRSLLEWLDADLLHESSRRFIIDCRKGPGGPTLEEFAFEQKLNLTILKDDVDPGGVTSERFETAGALVAVQERIHGFDAGFVLSGDGSLVRVIDARGNEISSDILAALLLDYYCETRPGELRHVGRSIAASHLVDAVATRRGLGIIEAPNGFAELGHMLGGKKVGFAVDERGGLSFATHSSYRDGFAAMLLVAEMLGRNRQDLGERVEGLHRQFGSFERRHLMYPLGVIDLAEVRRRLGNPPTSLAERAIVETVELEGRKLLFADGSWVVLRIGETGEWIDCWAEASSSEDVTALLVAAQQYLFAE